MNKLQIGPKVMTRSIRPEHIDSQAKKFMFFISTHFST